MAVLTKSTDIFVSNDTEKDRVLSVLNNTEKPSTKIMDRLSKAMQTDVEEKFFTHGR